MVGIIFLSNIMKYFRFHIGTSVHTESVSSVGRKCQHPKQQVRARVRCARAAAEWVTRCTSCPKESGVNEVYQLRRIMSPESAKKNVSSVAKST